MSRILLHLKVKNYIVNVKKLKVKSYKLKEILKLMESLLNNKAKQIN